MSLGAGVRSKYDFEFCPFCGKTGTQEVRNSAKWGWFVRCRHCKAVGPSAGSKEGAVAAYNTRPGAEQGRLL